MKKLTLLMMTLALLQSSAIRAQHNKPKFNDVEPNTKSNVQTFLTNYGIYGMHVANQEGGTFWKRGSTNQYVFGGGFWFGAIKARYLHDRVTNKDSLVFRKMAVTAYDPNSGTSDFAPIVGYPCPTLADSVRAARCYFGSDFDAQGTPSLAIDPSGYDKWPIWKSTDGDPFGTYISSLVERNSISGSPVFLSDEDVFSRFNDSDLRLYFDGADVSAVRGYPLGLNVEQRTYFFNSGPLKDVMIIRYEITHTASDTLSRCWFAPAMDFDIGSGKGAAVAVNDQLRYYSEDPSLSLTVGWSETIDNSPDKGKGLGYLGVTFLQTPAVNTNNEIDHSAGPDKELGLVTHRNWIIANDPTNDDARYDFMSLGLKDSISRSGDKRLLIATGPFHLLPHEKFVVSFALLFASPAASVEATGKTADLANLVELCKSTHKAYNAMRVSGRFTDVEKVAEGQSFDIIPNPNYGSFRVHLPNSSDAAELHVYSMLGLECYGALVRDRQTVSVNSLTNGLYLCRVRSGDNWESKLIQVTH